MLDHHEHAKTIMDTVSLITVVGTLMEILPPIAALLTIIWTSINIYESQTFQKFLKKFKGEDNG